MPLFDGKKGTVRTSSFADAQKSGDNFRLWNTPERLVHYRDNNKINEIIVADTNIVLIASDAPYSSTHIMIGVFNQEIFDRSADWTNGMFIYDCPERAQTAYWAVALNSIKEMNSKKLGTKATFIQNAFSVVSNSQPGREIKAGRSAYYPHGHTVAFDLESLEPGVPNITYLTEERDLYSTVSNIFIEIFADKLKSSGLDKVLKIESVINHVEEYPHGYEIEIDDPLETDMKAFSELMKIHHETYAEAMQAVLASIPEDIWNVQWPARKPFPSYRDYLYYENGKLRYRVCPVLLCPEGALEPAGIKLIRDKEIPNKFENYEEFKRSLVEAAGRIIESADKLLKE